MVLSYVLLQLIETLLLSLSVVQNIDTETLNSARTFH